MDKFICKKNFNYINIIIQKRSKLLSEEKMFKMDITLKYLCEKNQIKNNQGLFLNFKAKK